MGERGQGKGRETARERGSKENMWRRKGLSRSNWPRRLKQSGFILSRSLLAALMLFFTNPQPLRLSSKITPVVVANSIPRRAVILSLLPLVTLISFGWPCLHSLCHPGSRLAWSNGYSNEHNHQSYRILRTCSAWHMEGYSWC